MRSVAGDIEPVDVLLRLPAHDPLGERLADAAALKEASHHAAGEPVAALARDRADEWIAVGREGKGAVHPFTDAGPLQDRISPIDELQFLGDAIDVLLKQLYPEIPGRPVHFPVLRTRLVDADQHPLLVLAHVGEALEIDDDGQLLFPLGDLGNQLRDEIMVLDR